MHWMLQDIWLYWILRKDMCARYDVVIAGGPDSVLFAWLMKRFGRANRIVYYDYDYFPYVHDYRGLKKLVRKLVDWRERIGVSLADEVISVSRPLVDLRYQQGAKKVSLIPNGVETDRFSAERKKKQPPHPPTIIYTGTIDNRWGIDLAIEAMPQILTKCPNTQLVIVGEGLDEENLKAQANALGLAGSVNFLGKRPYEELPSIMANADIGVASSRPDIFRHYASPLKLIEYMAAGLAVICSGGGEAEMMVDESGAGANIQFSAEEFAEAAIRILTDPEVMRQHSESGMKYAQGRSWDCVGIKLSDVLKRNTETF
jgi:glycosyltransferase involved in cell wall biosynthesis